MPSVGGLLRQAHHRRLKRGVFKSIVDLQAAINRFVAETNDDPRPFTSTANPDKIIAAVKGGLQVLDSVHWQPLQTALRFSLPSA